MAALPLAGKRGPAIRHPREIAPSTAANITCSVMEIAVCGGFEDAQAHRGSHPTVADHGSCRSLRGGASHCIARPSTLQKGVGTRVPGRRSEQQPPYPLVYLQLRVPAQHKDQ